MMFHGFRTLLTRVPKAIFFGLLMTCCLPLAAGMISAWPRKRADRLGLLAIFGGGFLLLAPVIAGFMEPLYDVLPNARVSRYESGRTAVFQILVLVLGYTIVHITSGTKGTWRIHGFEVPRSTSAAALLAVITGIAWIALDANRGNPIVAATRTIQEISQADPEEKARLMREIEKAISDRM